MYVFLHHIFFLTQKKTAPAEVFANDLSLSKGTLASKSLSDLPSTLVPFLSSNEHVTAISVYFSADSSFATVIKNGTTDKHILYGIKRVSDSSLTLYDNSTRLAVTTISNFSPQSQEIFTKAITVVASQPVWFPASICMFLILIKSKILF